MAFVFDTLGVFLFGREATEVSNVAVAIAAYRSALDLGCENDG